MLAFTQDECEQLKQIDWERLFQLLKTKQLLQDPVLLQAYVYTRGCRDFQFFIETFFPEFCQLPFSRMHREFFQAEANPVQRGRREVIAAPRSHAKTTIKMLIKAVHAIVYGYEPFILIVGFGKEHAEDKVQQILDQLNKPEIVSFFGKLGPDKSSRKGRARGGKQQFLTETGIKVMARSREQEMRGISHGANRPSLIICDDVENLEECQSPEMRHKIQEWFFKTVLKVGQIDGSTNVLVIGTCLHSESLLSLLLANPGWKASKYQAIEHFSTRQDLWQTWIQIYNDLSNPNRLQAADAFYEANQDALLQGTQVLWPEGDSYVKLMKQMISEGQAAFYSEKQNDPYDPERQLFRMDEAKTFSVQYEGHQPVAIQWLDGSGKVIPWDRLKRLIAYHDPALGERPGGQGGADYAAIVVVAQDQDGYLYLLDCYLEKATPSAQIQAALSLHAQWQLDGLYLESNHFQYLLKDSYHQAQAHVQDAELLRVQGVFQHQNKIERVTSTLEPVIANGHLLFSNSLPKSFIQQMILFPTGHDDGPDALQGAVSQLRKRDYNALIADPDRPLGCSVKDDYDLQRIENDLKQMGAVPKGNELPSRKPATPVYPEPYYSGNEGGYSKRYRF